MSQLFSPLTIKSVTFRNRITVSPMCEYSSEDGFANQWHLVHLGSRAVGGAGLIITEAAAVSPEGRISPDDLGIWKDEHIEKLAEINTFLEAQGAVAGVQLAHAGRKASVASAWKGGKVVSPMDGGWLPVAPSAVAFNPSDVPPLALDAAGIQKVVNDFKTAARRVLKAGFKVIELHAAHGYLLHQFLSPLSNKRTDEYGGSFENRIRLLLEVIQAVHTEWPRELPLFVRISATDWADGGWNADESVQLVEVLKTVGVDLIDVSTGGLVPGVKIPLGPAYQAPFAARIRKETGMLTGAVGLITTAHQAEELLVNGTADLILMARELLRDPYFPLHAARKLGEDVAWPVQYERAKPR
ncbi:NADH:flavin oxidoreductase/NADH oxidase [Chitinophaga horti]|uniref:NADH:flavin oxidoreductase/NADH oxidase n=1 Tax=Chitinophaga horti TaxID=2920382 RepID=A0ABY6IYC2_9BACT|nr:NADH:flavin oxidoreductase/NADH oxidase [Chitinophaga horti]UYQ92378.1 NADH:flavin oxidoreductase/NADH oxidase [Chitinophaga horti]